MLETIKTPIIVGLVVLPYVCGYLLSTLLFASEMTIFVYGCMGISNSNNAGEEWPFWIYILYVLILLYLGVWYDIALYYLLKNWNQIQARVNPDRVVVPWKSSGDEEDHDYTLPVGSSTLTVMIAFIMLLLGKFGITIYITHSYTLIMVASYLLLSLILIVMVGLAFLSSAWNQYPNMPQFQDENKEDQEQNVDDGLNQSKAVGDETQQNETNGSLEEQEEREVEENNPKEEILVEHASDLIPQIQDVNKEDQEQNVDNGLNQSQATVHAGEEAQQNETNDNLEVQGQEVKEKHMIDERMEEQAHDLKIIQDQSKMKITEDQERIDTQEEGWSVLPFFDQEMDQDTSRSPTQETGQTNVCQMSLEEQSNVNCTIMKTITKDHEEETTELEDILPQQLVNEQLKKPVMEQQAKSVTSCLQLNAIEILTKGKVQIPLPKITYVQPKPEIQNEMIYKPIVDSLISKTGAKTKLKRREDEITIPQEILRDKKDLKLIVRTSQVDVAKRAHEPTRDILKDQGTSMSTDVKMEEVANEKHFKPWEPKINSWIQPKTSKKQKTLIQKLWLSTLKSEQTLNQYDNQAFEMEEGNYKGEEVTGKEDKDQLQPPQEPKLCWTKEQFKTRQNSRPSVKEPITKIDI